MALGFDYRPAGTQLPIVKYHAVEARFLRIDRTARGVTATDITDNFAAVFDMDAIEVGWMAFGHGTRPDMRLFPLGQEWPEAPAPHFKRGVRLTLQLSERHGGGVRELSSTSGQFIAAVDALHDEFLAGRADNPGRLPVVVLAGAQPGGQPEFTIAGWVERPEGGLRG